MPSTNKLLAVILAAGFFAFAAPSRFTVAQSAPAAAQGPVPTPDATKVAAASPEAVKLLKLMDADKNGKISHAEFMAFMEAEFQRLDVDHDGQLDLKELEKSQLAVSHHGGTRR